MHKKTKPWVQQYVPKSSKEVVGQEKAVAELKRFVVNFKNERKKALILHGPTGCGKTSSVYAIANELNLEIVELNASDVRNSEGISNIIGNASKQMSLFARGKVILLDEIDGVSGTKDRGGVPELKRIIQYTKFPIIMTANSPYDKKFSDIRKISFLVEMEPLSYASVFEILKTIADHENIAFEETALKALARRAGGDGRAAVNDFQMLAANKEVTLKDLEALGDREQQEAITTALTRVFKTTDPIIAKHAFDNVTDTMDQVMLWVDENLPKEYEKPEDIARAYDYISKADVMNRRIRRWQHWRFLVYIRDYLSAGIAVSKDEKYRKMTTLSQSERPLKIWLANRKYQKRLAICEKIAVRCHCSKKYAVHSTYPFLKSIFKSKNKDEMHRLIEYFDLDKDEIDYLKR